MTDMPIVRVVAPEAIKIVRVLVPGIQGPPGAAGAYQPSFAPAVVRTIGEALDDLPSLRSYANGVGLGNETADTDAWLQAMASGDRHITVPTCPFGAYLIGDGAIATKHFILEGAGSSSPLRIMPDFPAGKPYLTIKPAINEQYTLLRLANLFFRPEVDGLGSDGIVIDHTSNAAVSNSELVFEQVQVGEPTAIDQYLAPSGVAFRYVPHASDPNGLYTSKFDSCHFVGGIQASRFGDSNLFQNVWVKGRNIGFDIDFVTGAANTNFINCNSTVQRQAFWLKNAINCGILGCQLELIAQWQGAEPIYDPTRAMIVLDAGANNRIHGNNIDPFVFNAINPALSNYLGADCISIINATVYNDIRYNRLVTKSRLGFQHLRRPDNASINTIGVNVLVDNNLDSSEGPVIGRNEIAGVPPVGNWARLALLNSWLPANTAGTSGEGLLYKAYPDSSAEILIRIAGGTRTAGTQIAIGLPVKAAPKKTETLAVQCFDSTDSTWKVGFINVNPSGVITVGGNALPGNSTVHGRLRYATDRIIERTLTYTAGSSGTGIANASIRNVHSGFAQSAGQVRMRFRAAAGGPLIADHAAIGIRSASTDTTNAIPVELTFNNGSLGFNIPAGQMLWSDWMTLVIARTDSVLSIIDFAATADSYSLVAFGAEGYYLAAGTDSYNVADMPGTPSLVALSSIGVDAVEVR